MSGLRIGSLCTGYGGLDAAVHAVFGGELAWVSDIDPGAAQILKHRMPDVPNIGDLTTTDWAAVEPIDIVCGGYPCQPFSTAGKRKGTSDERHIWPFIARALGVLRPRVAIFENVGGHLRLGFDTVLADLATLGFDVEWCVVRASEVGAPHQRRRLFIYATAADTADFGHERGGRAWGWGSGPADHDLSSADAASVGRGEGWTESARQQGRPCTPGGGGAVASDARREGLEIRQVELDGPERQAAERGCREPSADADCRGLTRNPECHGRPEDGQPERAPGLDADGHHVQRPDWGRFAPAIHRWEAATGRPAPWATDDRNRLSPAFVEWLMGLEAGWVTDVPGLSRTQQLHALGNGVVPQQAEAAIRLLVARSALTLAPA